MAVAKKLPVRNTGTWRWIRAGVIVLAISIVCYFAVRALSPRVRDMQPAELKTAMDTGALKLETAIQQINRLDVRERRELMQSPEAQQYFRKLPPESRVTLIRETLDRTIRQQIERYRGLNTKQRAEFIAEIQIRQALERERLENLPPEERAAMRQTLSEGQFEQVLERAVQAYLSASSSAERAELAPLFEAALSNVKLARSVR